MLWLWIGTCYVKGCKVVVEDLLCNRQERNYIHNEKQINVNKDDEFIAKNHQEIT